MTRDDFCFIGFQNFLGENPQPPPPPPSRLETCDLCDLLFNPTLLNTKRPFVQGEVFKLASKKQE